MPKDAEMRDTEGSNEEKKDGAKELSKAEIEKLTLEGKISCH